VEFVQSVIHDITRRWQSEQRNQAHDAMLEMIARDADLTDILTALVRHIESEDKTSLCSIMLADMEGKHLLTGAAPSLPAFYNQAVNGIEIGVGFGSCGTAAALGERMVVEDVTTHAYWKPYAKLAQEAGLRACWSEPVLSSKGKVLGTFAIYHTEPKCPQAADFERIVFATNLAAIAIENRFTHEELERRAYTDYLTGLANRRHFLELAENELARTVRYGKEMSMLMLDLDHFKQVNDTFGHQVGDLVLKRLAELCRTTLRDVDIVGRIGGEEFAVLLPETGNQQAMDAAERLRATIAAAHVTLGSGLPVRFSASFGVTTLQEKDINIDILLNQADQALYRAKNEGRNCVRLYSAGNDDR
jgi:diguanylate cyclase (GGDEF)-like protein